MHLQCTQRTILEHQLQFKDKLFPGAPLLSLTLLHGIGLDVEVRGLDGDEEGVRWEREVWLVLGNRI